jgi:hypothetical protein
MVIPGDKRIQIARKRAELVASYPALWEKIIAGWNSPSPRDRGWLMYSANYLFRTQGVRWAIDPLSLHHRLPEAPEMDISGDLQGLNFALLTHRHNDHLDLDLLHSLRHEDIRWVIPEDILQEVKREAGLPAERILVPHSLRPFVLNGIRIVPFPGMHWQNAPDFPQGRRGVPAMGYLVEQGNQRWLFPGDIRTYNSSAWLDFGTVDILFAHMWLGRGAAFLSKPPLLEEFCRFCLAFRPRRINLTHLEEFGHDDSDIWDLGHAKLVISRLRTLAPALPVEFALTGDELLLEGNQ